MKRLTMIFLAVLLAFPALASETELEFGPNSVKKPNEGYARVGILTCDIDAGVGLLITSRKDLECDYIRNIDGAEQVVEIYTGSIRKFGIDVGATGGGVMKWVIFAPTTYDVDAAGLSGTYSGATAELSAIVGVGANALIGGSKKAIVLQPFSVQVQTGINFALGVTSMTIEKTEEVILSD